MDNNNSGKPRKKVTKEVLRRRQLTALSVIALIVLIFIILIANACTDKSPTSKNEKTSTTTTTTTTTTTEIVTEPPTTMTTTTPVPTADPEISAQVQISTNEVYLNVGESQMPIISAYPEGSSETNEVWTSSDTNIATVDSLGNITAINAGECYIILTLDNNSAVEVQIKVTVTGTAIQQDIIQDNELNNNLQNSQGYIDTQGYQDTQNYQENQYQYDYQQSESNELNQSDLSAY